MTSALAATDVTLSYPGSTTPIVIGVSATLEPGALTVIVGPNACGKSTLLRAFGRILRPDHGEVTLDGRDVHRYGSKEFARRVGLLPQSTVAPDGITVGDLVARGRFPHQGALRQWSDADEDAVVTALERTSTVALADRYLSDLSGGQRQRVWIAMALAQQTDVLLLDEPTTFLDLAHQLEVLELCRELTDVHGTTVVAVLHDLNHAARYADRIIAMRDGAIVASGTPHEVITSTTVTNVFGIACRVIDDPETSTPLVVPAAGAHARRRAALTLGTP
ncbi:ABC transporter ATP-binding protein [Cryobacterium arcticum]|uniref:ABC transporter domain-containing protein n=1 Tax=Cryobacterium arcticum TaxID=670052 RepID=A0A317ZNB0_9MICO|nr:ABC transporter ATP-binding protein [Cryobacterium arcticum]PXA68000.1 hypothetical protein CTB96_15180 [Cryobacterium arcticum]